MKLFISLFCLFAAVAKADEVPGEIDCAKAASYESTKLVVRRAVEAYKLNAASLTKELIGASAKWVERSLALYEGTKVLASSVNPSLNGRDLTAVRDVDKLAYVESQEKLATAEKGEGCLRYRFANPARGGKVEERTVYVARADGRVYLVAPLN